MNHEVLQAILVDEFGATEKGGQIDLPKERRVTLLVSFGDQVLRVPKVKSVKFTKTYVALIADAESFYVAAEHDFAVKTEDADRRDDRPGFH